MNTKLLKGKVRISRWTGGGNPHTGITISLVDEISRSQCVEIHLTIEALGMCLTQSEQECEFEWRPDVVGMTVENKTEVVLYDCTNKDQKVLDKALAPFEVDGWKARRSDMSNHHRRTPSGEQRVVFLRHVKAHE